MHFLPANYSTSIREFARICNDSKEWDLSIWCQLRLHVYINTSAECERSFSTMKRVITNDKTSFQEETAENFLLISHEGRRRYGQEHAHQIVKIQRTKTYIKKFEKRAKAYLNPSVDFHERMNNNYAFCCWRNQNGKWICCPRYDVSRVRVKTEIVHTFK